MCCNYIYKKNCIALDEQLFSIVNGEDLALNLEFIIKQKYFPGVEKHSGQIRL